MVEQPGERWGAGLIPAVRSFWKYANTAVTLGVGISSNRADLSRATIVKNFHGRNISKR